MNHTALLLQLPPLRCFVAPPKHLLCSATSSFPSQRRSGLKRHLRAETKEVVQRFLIFDPQKSPGWAAQGQGRMSVPVEYQCVGCLWHQGDAASSIDLSQCQTFPAFSGNEFSPCLVSRAGKPGRGGTFTCLFYFGAFLPSRPTEWLRSRLNCSCVTEMEIFQAAKGMQCCWEWGIPTQWGF